jgi:prephenate dehydrogenase
MKTVFLTGATGFIGRHVVAALLRRGCRIRCLVRTTSDVRHLQDESIELVEGSLRDLRSVAEALVGCDTVLHLGGIVTSASEAELNAINGTACGALADLCRALPAPPRFVAAHPMAGSEAQGPAHAQADLFDGKPCILCADETTDPESRATVEALWRTVGMKIIEMTAAEHDRQTALTSHLPHVAAVLLARVARAQGGMDVASTGFRDTTRLASSNPPMRSDILLANRKPILEALGAFEREMAGLRDELGAADEPAILERLEEARAFRNWWIQGRDEAGAP